MIALPVELCNAIAQVLDAVPETRWLNAARALSEQYRNLHDTDAAPVVRTRLDALGYAALLMPATYAQLYGEMRATAACVPSWQPKTMLDMGSGPGTALWAATACWQSLFDLTAWEREPILIALGRDLAHARPHPALRNARWVQRNLSAPIERRAAFDLVVLGHVLGEIPPGERSEAPEGLPAARRAVFGGVPGPRCQVHLQPNAQAYVPQQELQAAGAADRRAICTAPKRADADRLLARTVQQFAKTASKLAPWCDTALPEGLSGFNRPAAQRTRLRTVTAQERLQQEIGRRPRGGRRSEGSGLPAPGECTGREPQRRLGGQQGLSHVDRLNACTKIATSSW